MRITNLFGREVSFRHTKYVVDWDKKSKSNLQFTVKQFLKFFWRNDVVLEEFTIPASLLKVDFLNLTKKIAVEVHGRQHQNYVKHFHKSRAGFKKSFERDKQKEDWIRNSGFKFIEIYDEDLKNLSRQYLIEKCDIDII